MRRFRYYDIILALFAAILLISNIAATKIVSFGPIITDGGAILFPLIYILGDVLTEVYGYKHARRAIWMGFIIMLVGVAVFTIVRYLPPAAVYQDQAAYEAVLGFFPRIVAASLIAYLVGEFTNSYILAKLKIKTKGKKLWQRLIASSIFGELFDTMIFAFVAFGGIIVGWDMVIYIAVGWAFKTGVEIIFLPITYRVIHVLKASEGIDYYDRTTNFSPFQFRFSDK
ncbi:MAG: queuosine precursor transporter [Candidatus Saccharimonas sp.]|nr:queuosine precursor transporter [Candidatus Saccharimonas sp.]